MGLKVTAPLKRNIVRKEITATAVTMARAYKDPKPLPEALFSSNPTDVP